jgi:hypothetical protein
MPVTICVSWRGSRHTGLRRRGPAGVLHRGALLWNAALRDFIDELQKSTDASTPSRLYAKMMDSGRSVCAIVVVRVVVDSGVTWTRRPVRPRCDVSAAGSY